MRTRLIVTALTTSALVAGCAHTRGGGDAPAATLDVPCQFKDTKAKTCVVRGQKAVCNVYVGEFGGLTHVYPYTLSVPLDARNVVVVWHLQVPAAEFIKRDGEEDGPKWRNGSGSEFEAGEPTDDPDGEPKGLAQGDRYRIKYKNQSTSRGPHNYVIQYRGLMGVKRCDPVIVSEAG